MNNIVNGFEIPKFVPTGRYVLVPALDNIIRELEDSDLVDNMDDDDSLVDSEQELSEKDFQTTVLAKGEGVTASIEPGDKIQIIPNGEWFVSLTIDDVKYFLVKDHVIVGIFK
jgi:hypothetical protein